MNDPNLPPIEPEPESSPGWLTDPEPESTQSDSGPTNVDPWPDDNPK